MAIRLWGSKTPGNAQDTRDITLMRNKKRVNISIKFIGTNDKSTPEINKMSTICFQIITDKLF